jgi:hypothetical protein
VTLRRVSGPGGPGVLCGRAALRPGSGPDGAGRVSGTAGRVSGTVAVVTGMPVEWGRVSDGRPAGGWIGA